MAKAETREEGQLILKFDVRFQTTVKEINHQPTKVHKQCRFKPSGNEDIYSVR